MERMMTRVRGCSLAARAAASSPFMPGMEMSKKATSGFSSPMSRNASSPSAASPTTSTSAISSSSERSPARTSEWSSASSVRSAIFASFRQGEVGADLGAATRSGIDLQLSAGQGDALLHAEQSLTVALGYPPQGPAQVEALAIVPHAQEERAVARRKLDLYLLGLRVAGDVGERLLHQTKAGGLECDGQPRKVGDLEERLPATPLRLAPHLPSPPRGRPESVQEP